MSNQMINFIYLKKIFLSLLIFLLMKSNFKSSANIIFAKAGVSCFLESLVQGSSSVFQLNICAKNPRLRKYEKRCMIPLTKT
jgi:hypothetical protein